MNEQRAEQRDVALSMGQAHDRPFHFGSASGVLATPAAGTLLRFEQRADAPVDVARALAFRDRAVRGLAVVAGALAFDATRLPLLRLHVRAARGERTEVTRGADTPVIGAPSSVVLQPTPDGYAQAVSRAVARIHAGELDKVVLARALDLSLGCPLDVDALLARLAAQNPSAYVFGCDVSRSDAERRVIVGASPELLVAKRGATVRSHPLAGSLPRGADAVEDRALAASLSRSPKNLHEHALVVEAVADTLAPYCRDLRVPREPALVQTGAMWHLGTEIAGMLRDPEVSSLALAMALHPTPAVCGVPRARAHAAIGELEGFERDYFAGAVGYCDALGDGEWAVTIRCAELTEHTLRLYAGAGIVGDSSPADELAETTAKLRTMSRALGFEQLFEGL